MQSTPINPPAESSIRPAVRFPFSPPAYFFIFLASNLLLSYFGFPREAKLIIGFLGLLLPFAVGWARRGQSHPGPDFPFPTESLPPVPGWLWAGAAFAGIFLRLDHLISLSQWPMPDEGDYTFYAMELSEKGIWKILYSMRQHPPLYYWAYGLFLKAVPPSLFSLWLFPALLSVAALGAAFWAVRTCFPGPLAFPGFFLAATGFWPVYIGRICSNYVLTFFWELAALGLLGIFLRNQEKPSGRRMAAFLGLWTGLGLFTFVLWALVAAAMAAVVFRAGLGKERGVRRAFFIPLGFFGILFAALYATHSEAVRQIAFLGKGVELHQRLMDAFVYIKALFWGADGLHYGPVWGGLLNPVTGAFFFLGLMNILGDKKTRTRWWVLAGLALFLLPGMISKELETFRILFVFPLLVFTALSGMASFLSGSGRNRLRIGVLFLLLTAGAGLDAYQLYGPYHRTWGTPSPTWVNLKSVVGFRAYQHLEALSSRGGPGLVLSDLGSTRDLVLNVASYPFDAVQNPRLRLEDAGWAAVVVAEDYRPFLSQRFRETRWFDLGKSYPGPRMMPLVLGVIPLGEKNRAALEKWVEADRGFHSFNVEISDHSSWDPQQPVLDSLASLPGQLDHDPFLWSCYLERVISYYSPSSREEYALVQDLLARYLKNAYPLPHLLYYQKALRKMNPQP